jgi:DNA-binding winged helix-turn-helix (wHTH) protein/tetratricopeptide (TPR) repeat protein
MIPARVPVSAYRFGPFRLNVRDRILERDGSRVLLTPKVVDTLVVLVENAHQVVTKEALMRAVWPDVTVVESGLTRNISVLRKALEGDGPEGSYIETIPRRGYRFVAELAEEDLVIRADANGPPPRKSGRRAAWLAAALVVFAGLAGITWRWLRPVPQHAPEPRVRIGEHLLYKLAPEQSVKAVQEFEQAVSSDPSSARAHAGLSISLMQSSSLGVQPFVEVGGRAEAEARRALQLDPHLATAHYASGLVNLLYRWRFDQAEKEFLRALELDPKSVLSRLGYTQLKFATGEVKEAIRIVEEALQIDPASPLLGARYCQAFYYAREFHRAEAECRKVIDREPRYALAHYYLALSLGWLGQTESARKALDQTDLAPRVLEVDRAWLRFREGDLRPTLQSLQQRRALIAQNKVNASAKLLLSVMLGRMDEAFEALEAGIAHHALELLTIHIDPRLDPLRSDKRYADVLRRAGLNASRRL